MHFFPWIRLVPTYHTVSLKSYRLFQYIMIFKNIMTYRDIFDIFTIFATDSSLHYRTGKKDCKSYFCFRLQAVQVNPIFCRSLLTVLLQFAGWPGPLLYPGTCQYSACCGTRWWSIRRTCPSQRNRLSLSMLPPPPLNPPLVMCIFQTLLMLLSTAIRGPAVQKVSSLDILDNNIFHTLYISET